MYFDKNSIEEIKRLSENKDYAYFFDNMENKKENTPEELLTDLSFIFMNEFKIKPDQANKVKFFLKLGYFTAK